MMIVQNLIARLQTALASDEGANLVEYALLVSLIAAVTIIAVTQVGKETLSNVFPVTSSL